MIKYDLNNRVAVVTGGAQGFGLAITERFIEAGAKVVIWDIDENAAKEAIDKVKSEHLSHQIVDVTNFEIVNKNLEEVDVDVEKDVEVDDVSKETDIDVKTSLPGESEDVDAVLGLLTKAREEADRFADDPELGVQIGNTITYFTRKHVAQN